jgi:hypothetical protein
LTPVFSITYSAKRPIHADAVFKLTSSAPGRFALVARSEGAKPFKVSGFGRSAPSFVWQSYFVEGPAQAAKQHRDSARETTGFTKKNSESWPGERRALP